MGLALKREGGFRRLYAIKRLHPHLRQDPDFRTMFLDEAKIAGWLRHPNIVSVLDVGEDEDGPYLVMDYVEGLPVSKLIAAGSRLDPGAQLPMQVVLQIGTQVARGLDAVHRLTDRHGNALHLVHRDVSPQNILVAYDGVAKLTDFGIAKALGRSTHTRTGVLKGKLGYMSPEQLRFRQPDGRSDLFALGVVLYELFSGERLYPYDEGARRILEEPPPDLGDIRPDAPPPLVELLFELLSKHPDDRPEDASSVEQRLDEILDELVEAEGRLRLDTYMQQSFATERANEEARLSAALGQVEEGGSNVPVASMRTAEHPERAGLDQSVARKRPWHLLYIPWIAAAALGISLATVAAWSWRERGHTPSIAEAPQRVVTKQQRSPPGTANAADSAATTQPREPALGLASTAPPLTKRMRSHTRNRRRVPTKQPQQRNGPTAKQTEVIRGRVPVWNWDDR